jgi:uncharacterized membrane protein YeaQ/YmgE (transglycosylase-associated protein family)
MNTLGLMLDLGIVLGLILQFCIDRKDILGYAVSAALGGVGALLGGYIGAALNLYPLTHPLAFVIALVCGGTLTAARLYALRDAE